MDDENFEIQSTKQPVESDLWDPRRNTLLVPGAFLFEIGKSPGNGIAEENNKWILLDFEEFLLCS